MPYWAKWGELRPLRARRSSFLLKSSGRLISGVPMMLWVSALFTESIKTKSVLPLRKARDRSLAADQGTEPLRPFIPAVTIPEEAM